MSAAWQQFGRRHYRFFVGFSLAARVLPFLAIAVLLAAAGVGVVWLARHAHAHTPAVHFSLAWLEAPAIVAGLVLAVAGAAFAAWRWWNPLAELTRLRVAGVLIVALAAATTVGMLRT